MILRDIFLDLDREQYPTQVAYPFKMRSRCLCHFVGRHLWQKQLRVPEFRRVSVTLSRNSQPAFFVNSCQVACITLPFDEIAHQNLAGDALQEFYIDCLTRAADRFCSVHAEVLAAIHEGIALFRAAGYRNDWIAQARRLRATKLAATLACRLTPERFELRLIVSRPPTPLYDHVILACDPDEVAFAHRFKDVVEADGKVVVTSRHSKPLLTLSRQEIEANQAPTLRRERSYLRDEAHLACRRSPRITLNVSKSENKPASP